MYICTIAEPADYSEFSGGVRFSADTRLSSTLIVSTVLDNINETQEVFLMKITNVVTACPFEIQTNVSTVTVKDRESKLTGTATTLSLLNYCVPPGITSSVQFVSPEIMLPEREGETVDACVSLLLLNNETVLGHEISFYLRIATGYASKFVVLLFYRYYAVP